MKARNENGTIILYPELPIHYSSETLGTPLVDFRTMDKEIHESEGFFEVVTPEFDKYTQKLGEIYFDEVGQVFTYPVETLEVPIERPVIPIRYKTLLTPFEFKNRFTSQERIAGRILAKTDVEVEDLWDMLNTATEVDLNNPMVIYGLPLLVQREILTQERCDEILTKYPI